MIAFTGFAAVLVAAALLFVLWPLLRSRPAARAGAAGANLAIYRDQFAELERDLALGMLDSAQYEVARAELQRRLLDEVGSSATAQPQPRASGKWTALAIAVALPLVAGALYWRLGEPEGIGAPKQAAQQQPAVTPEQFEVMTQQLAQRMASNPDDPVGWLMLGRAYKALGRRAEAVEALSQANRRKPGDAEVLVEYAEALAQAAGGTLKGEPARLLSQALAVAPDDPKALTLAGGAAFEAGDYAKAIDHWERLAAQIQPDSELGRALASGMARARSLARGGTAPSPAAAGATLRGEVRLATALKNRAAPDDTVFVFARAADGPRMPLAVIRKQVKDLPADFRLDDSMAMNPELKLSAFPRVVVAARVSRSGSATPRSGDLQGESKPVTPGAGGVSVVIDQVVP